MLTAVTAPVPLAAAPGQAACDRGAGQGAPQVRRRTFGATAADVGRRLGVSKQAAGKTIDRLGELGYVERGVEPADRRRKLVRLTPRGTEALMLSAEAFERVRARWAGLLGAGRVAALEADLREVAPGQAFRLDVPGWLGG